MSTKNKSTNESSNDTIHSVIKRLLKVLTIPILIIVLNMIAILGILSLPYWIITGKTLVNGCFNLTTKMIDFLSS